MKNLSVVSLVFCGFGLLMAGCDPPKVRELRVEKPATPESSATEEKEAEPVVQDVDAQKWLAAEDLPYEDWHIQYAGGRRVGYHKTRIEKGETLYRIERVGVFELKPNSAGEIPRQYRIELESFEYPDGRLASFSERTQLGTSVYELTGQQIGERLNLTTKTEDELVRSSIVWKEGTWGVLGLEAMLRAQPMQPGERRTCDIFVVKLNDIVSVELTAAEPEVTPVPGDQLTLIPIEAVMTRGEESTVSRSWADERGTIFKTVSLGPQMLSTFRAPPEVGQQIADEMEIKLQVGRSAKFYGETPEPEATQVTYVAEVASGDVYRLWAKGGRQAVKSLTALTARITVGPQSSPGAELKLESRDDYLASSSWMPIEHESLRNLAANLQRKVSEQRQMSSEEILQFSAQLARAVETEVSSTTVSNALEVARRLKGDSKDKAILLAALLRSRKIPARLAFGVRLNRQESRMEPHVWTEAYTGEKGWLSIDMETGEEVGVGCLKMFDKAFNEENPYPPFLRLLESLDGELTIRMVGRN